MRMKIDENLCSGQSRCWKFAPEVFELDDEGFNAARGGIVPVPPGLEKEAARGMKACPERAITLLDE